MSRRIVIAGSVAQKPLQGGHTWVFLQYMLGFRGLGWDVLFLDRLEPSMCGGDIEASDNLRRFCQTMERFGFSESYALSCDSGSRFIGQQRREVLQFARQASCILNVMGFLADEEVLGSASRRVFLDIDPGFPQMWRELGLADVFAGHTDFVTIGENMGAADCAVPMCGLTWIRTPQPVVLAEWPRQMQGGSDSFTSIASWRGAYGPVEYRGNSYGLRVHEFRNFFDLPRRSGLAFELALNIHSNDCADLSRLEQAGWRIIDPKTVASDTWKYREYVQRSKAELMIAKNMYVQANSGWFSDRSICYLASGRPVLAQDTGWSRNYPSDCGLVGFKTIHEAVAGAEEITRDYGLHCRRAREIAEEYFDSRKVLSRLVEKLGLA